MCRLVWRESMEPVFCPKPRRLSQLSGAADPLRPLRWHLGYQMEPLDSRPGGDVLDVILAKGSHGGRGDQHAGESPVASSPPYFCGSPPSRATNPLVLDARFGEEKAAPLTPLPALIAPAVRSPSATTRQGRVRASFGPKPAAVRIEGFDCLGGDARRGSCGITAVA
ncbi:hypothetical protein Taro_020654 [Colocasia esculenta]|uniref:Uncharacterized protein n=1 Tax=Colocasia esculenta TaxID=4460 RepID=A0A843UWX3_COLES|nr:hypothetical protein [Colocasia esculenta]